jgi:hypothetical protein
MSNPQRTQTWKPTKTPNLLLLGESGIYCGRVKPKGGKHLRNNSPPSSLPGPKKSRGIGCIPSKLSRRQPGGGEATSILTTLDSRPTPGPWKKSITCWAASPCRFWAGFFLGLSTKAPNWTGARLCWACLLMSGYTADVIVHHGVLEEGAHFVEKPFSPQRLLERVRQVLGASKT